MVNKKQLEGNWFHGDERKTNFLTRNYFDVTDFSRDRNAMGPGIYFTRIEYQARGYAGNDGYVYTVTVDLDPKRVLEDDTKPDESKLRKFIEKCPDKELLLNYSEIPNNIEAAVELNMESENMLDAIMGAYNDLYRRDAVLFAKVMTEIGYDAFYHKVNPEYAPEAIHLMVYNPKIIKVVKEEKRKTIKECRSLKHIMLFEEYGPVPGSAPPEKQLHVFDFDDTLVVSKDANAIALFDDGNPVHKNTRDVIDWLADLGLKKDDLQNGPNKRTIEETPNTKIWTAYVTSGALSKVSKQYDERYVTGSGEIPKKGNTLVIDFTPSSSIGKAKPIISVIDKLKKMEKEGAKTVVMTARKGEGEGVSMDGKTVKASNRNDVKAYLKAHGAEPDEVYGVSGKNKAEKIKDEFIKGNKDAPEEIHFYDDSPTNIETVNKELGGKVDADVFTYGPGKFDKKEADPNKPTNRFARK